MSQSAIISAGLVGLLGGIHCLTMCGGFMAAAAMRDDGKRGSVVPLVPARLLMLRQLGYHAGRIGAYVLLGAGVGFAGAAGTAADALGGAAGGTASGVRMVRSTALAAGFVTRRRLGIAMLRAGASRHHPPSVPPLSRPFGTRPPARSRR
jgi:sulfite exporter TauE/SafE